MILSKYFFSFKTHLEIVEQIKQICLETNNEWFLTFQGMTIFMNYKNDVYTKSKWIIPEMIDEEIPRFILIKCYDFGLCEEFTLVFACIKHTKRIEVNSNDIENVKNIWEKCGFLYHTTINGLVPIYMCFKLIFIKIFSEKIYECL